MINHIFEKLANNNSRIFKQQYLFEHRNTSLLKEVINLALNPFILFYIKKIPVYTNSDIQYTLEEAIQELYPIIKRVITGNAAIEHLTDILSHTSIDDAKVIERIISKDLKCGVSVSTVNSIWAGLIPEYPVMLASKFEQKLIDRLAFPVLIQEKVDGGRFNAIVRNNEVNFFSRSGNIIDIPNDQMKLAFIELGRLFDFPVVFEIPRLITAVSSSCSCCIFCTILLEDPHKGSRKKLSVLLLSPDTPECYLLCKNHNSQYRHSS